MADLKKTGACRRLVVTGCLAERYRDSSWPRCPEIDAVLGTGEVPQIVGALEGRQKAGAVPLPLLDKQALLAGSTTEQDTPSEPPVQVATPNVSGSGASATAARGGGAPRELNNALPTYLYDADTPRIARDAGALRLREGRRGLRLQVRVLHHSRRSGATIAAGRPTRSCDEARRLADRGVQGAAARLPGHDVLRHRPARARGARPPAARAERGRRPRVDPPALPLPDDHRRRGARRDGRVREGLPVRRSPAAARLRRGPPAHAAAGDARAPTIACSTGSATACPAWRSAPRSSSASRARPRPTSPSCRISSGRSSSTTSASSPTPTRRGRPAHDLRTTCRRP